MESQSDLSDMFYRGETTGRASNLQIQNFPALGLTALVGYGHAVYAIRDKTSGHITAFTAWDGFSMTTSCTLTKCGLSPRAEVEIADEKKGERCRVRHLTEAERAAQRDNRTAARNKLASEV